MITVGSFVILLQEWQLTNLVFVTIAVIYLGLIMFFVSIAVIYLVLPLNMYIQMVQNICF